MSVVETKTLTIRLAEVAPPVGEPDMRFNAYNPPWELREILAKKTEYAPGESVRVKYKVKNVGDAEGVGTVVIKDADTGATLQTYLSGTLAPGYSWRTADVGVEVGKMPAKDWRLSFKVTP